jgi:hypothetical protein
MAIETIINRKRERKSNVQNVKLNVLIADTFLVLYLTCLPLHTLFCTFLLVYYRCNCCSVCTFYLFTVCLLTLNFYLFMFLHFTFLPFSYTCFTFLFYNVLNFVFLSQKHVFLTHTLVIFTCFSILFYVFCFYIHCYFYLYAYAHACAYPTFYLCIFNY